MVWSRCPIDILRFESDMIAMCLEGAFMIDVIDTVRAMGWYVTRHYTVVAAYLNYGNHLAGPFVTREQALVVLYKLEQDRDAKEES